MGEGAGSIGGAKLAPQAMQKLASAGFSLPQCGQFKANTWWSFGKEGNCFALYPDWVGKEGEYSQLG